MISYKSKYRIKKKSLSTSLFIASPFKRLWGLFILILILAVFFPPEILQLLHLFLPSQSAADEVSWQLTGSGEVLLCFSLPTNEGGVIASLRKQLWRFSGPQRYWMLLWQARWDIG
ncbi:hypothetical protein M9H77_33645 [Catharanthus roseus]|uniref:Uncharacterized protein n=1 Tax=Catharanthus roseus TaxID=4058 RepID=A0ACB9ZJQ9_CATRO|nr:hypothetical protein M9H77_33645 [Catharanthus roseus]